MDSSVRRSAGEITAPSSTLRPPLIPRGASVELPNLLTSTPAYCEGWDGAAGRDRILCLPMWPLLRLDGLSHQRLLPSWGPGRDPDQLQYFKTAQVAVRQQAFIFVGVPAVMELFNGAPLPDLARCGLICGERPEEGTGERVVAPAANPVRWVHQKRPRWSIPARKAHLGLSGSPIRDVEGGYWIPRPGASAGEKPGKSPPSGDLM